MAQTFISTDDLNPGDVVATIGSGNGFTIVAKALPLVLAAFGRATGVATDASSRSAVASIQTVGAIPAAKTGLAAVAGPVRVSSTARCELVTAYVTGDYPLGTTDSSGLLTLNQMSVTPAPSGNVDTRASLQAVLTPANARTITVAEVSAPYKFDSTSVATADGWTLLTANDATPGRWVLQGDTISLAAGTSSATFAAAVTAAAGKAKVLLRPGAFPVNATTQLLSNTHIQLSEASALASTQTALGAFPGHYVFLSFSTSLNTAGTLASTPALGATTLSVSCTTKPTVGNILSVQHSVSWATYDVIAASGASSPWTVTIDRPVAWPWVSGDVTQEWTPTVHDLRIDGNGALVNGTGDQMLEYAQVRRASVRNIQYTPAAGMVASAFVGLDVGCRECAIEGLYVDFTGSAGSQNGIYIQSNERTVIRDCVVKNAALVGIDILDCYASGVESCHVFGCPRGFQINAFDGTTLGNFDCWLNGGSAIACGTGLYLDGSARTNIAFFSALKCSTYGIYVGPAAVSTRIAKCQVTSCAQGIIIQPGAKDTRIDGLEASKCTSNAISAGADCEINALYAKGASVSGTGIVLFAAGTVRIRNSETQNLSNTGYGVFVSGATRGSIEKHVHTGVTGGNSLGYYLNSGTVYLIDCVAATCDTGVFVANGVTAYISIGCDFSTCTTAVTLQSSAATAIVEQRGAVSKAVTSADVTLTFSEAQASKLVTTGLLTANRNVILPTVDGMEWSVFCNNTGAFTTTFKTAAGTGQVVAQGKRAKLQCDGTNIVRVSPDT